MHTSIHIYIYVYMYVYIYIYIMRTTVRSRRDAAPPAFGGAQPLSFSPIT